MARGYLGPKGDVKKPAMKKWFNTNYHYLVPEIDDSVQIRAAGSKIFDEFEEAGRLGIETRPVLVGPFTLLRLARFTGRKRAEDVADGIVRAYADVLNRISATGARWVQFDEPWLVTDLEREDVRLFEELYRPLLAEKHGVKVLVQTFFGDVRDSYGTLLSLPVDGIGLDFVEGAQSLSLMEKHGFPEDKTLFAGVVNGRNIWRNRYIATLRMVREIQRYAQDVVIGPSCSLLHVPYSVRHETRLSEAGGTSAGPGRLPSNIPCMPAG